MKSSFQKILISALILGVLISAFTSIPATFADHEPEHTFPNVSTPTNQQAGNADPVGELRRRAESGAEKWCFPNFFKLECFARGLAWVSYFFLYIVGVVLNVAGFAFNATLGITIDNTNYTAEQVPALDAGWKFSRDIVNIFFIFILLFIAIATILGLESYGAKALLPRLIIIALLVNFSFLVAQSIIFVSNALTVQLYNSIEAGPSPTASFLSFKFNKDVSAAIVSAFNPQQMLAKIPFDSLPSSGLTLFLAIIEIAFLGGALIIIGAFVLFAAAFFFIVRMGMLWFLMVLAPFGFVFLILPVTRDYAQTWWRKLSDQAIFAPTFMFLFVLVIRMIQTTFKNFFGRVGSVPGVTEFLFLMFLQASLMAALLLFALLIAKTMGIMGANTAIGMASAGGKWFRGYVGRGAIRGGRYPAMGVQKTLQALEKVPIAGTLAKPFLRLAQKPAAAVIRAAEEEKSKREEAYKKMSPTAVAATYRAAASPFERRTILKAAAETGRLEKFSEGELQTAYNQFKNLPQEAKAFNNILKFRPDFIARDTSYATRTDKLNKLQEVIGRMSEKDIEEKLDRKIFEDRADPANQLVHEAMVLSAGEREMAATIRKHGEGAREATKDAIARMGVAPTLDEMLRTNRSLLRGMYRNPALATQFDVEARNFETAAALRTPAITDLRKELNA